MFWVWMILSHCGATIVGFVVCCLVVYSSDRERAYQETRRRALLEAGRDESVTRRAWLEAAQDHGLLGEGVPLGSEDVAGGPEDE